MLAQKKIAIIGSGTMGRSIASGLLRSGRVKPQGLRATARTKASAEKVGKELGIPCETENAKATADADIVLLCVKPKDVAKAVESIRGPRKKRPPLVISIAAGISTGFIEGHFADATPVLRAMPNTPCLIGKGMTVLSKGSHATDGDVALATRDLRAARQGPRARGEAHGHGHGPLGERPGLHLHHHRGARGRRRDARACRAASRRRSWPR